MCVNKPTGKIHIVLINVLVWHLQYSCKTKIASHVFKETTWNNVKQGDSVRVDLETNKLSKNFHPYAFVICMKNQFFNLQKTVGHIPREISRHVYYFIKTKGGFVNSSVISTKYRPSPIPSGGLEIPLLLKFLCSEQDTFEKMKKSFDSLYDFYCSGVNDKESSDKEEAAIVIETDQSKPVSHTEPDQSKLVSYTDSSGTEEEKDLHVDVNFDEPIDLAIN